MNEVIENIPTTRDPFQLELLEAVKQHKSRTGEVDDNNNYQTFNSVTNAKMSKYSSKMPVQQRKHKHIFTSLSEEEENGKENASNSYKPKTQNEIKERDNFLNAFLDRDLNWKNETQDPVPPPRPRKIENEGNEKFNRPIPSPRMKVPLVEERLKTGVRDEEYDRRESSRQRKEDVVDRENISRQGAIGDKDDKIIRERFDKFDSSKKTIADDKRSRYDDRFDKFDSKGSTNAGDKFDSRGKSGIDDRKGRYDDRFDKFDTKEVNDKKTRNGDRFDNFDMKGNSIDTQKNRINENLGDNFDSRLKNSKETKLNESKDFALADDRVYQANERLKRRSVEVVSHSNEKMNKQSPRDGLDKNVTRSDEKQSRYSPRSKGTLPSGERLNKSLSRSNEKLDKNMSRSSDKVEKSYANGRLEKDLPRASERLDKNLSRSNERLDKSHGNERLDRSLPRASERLDKNLSRSNERLDKSHGNEKLDKSLPRASERLDKNLSRSNERLDKSHGNERLDKRLPRASERPDKNLSRSNERLDKSPGNERLDKSLPRASERPDKNLSRSNERLDKSPGNERLDKSSPRASERLDKNLTRSNERLDKSYANERPDKTSTRSNESSNDRLEKNLSRSSERLDKSGEKLKIGSPENIKDANVNFEKSHDSRYELESKDRNQTRSDKFDTREQFYGRKEDATSGRDKFYEKERNTAPVSRDTMKGRENNARQHVIMNTQDGRSRNENEEPSRSRFERQYNTSDDSKSFDTADERKEKGRYPRNEEKRDKYAQVKERGKYSSEYNDSRATKDVFSRKEKDGKRSTKPGPMKANLPLNAATKTPAKTTEDEKKVKRPLSGTLRHKSRSFTNISNIKPSSPRLKSPGSDTDEKLENLNSVTLREQIYYDWLQRKNSSSSIVRKSSEKKKRDEEEEKEMTEREKKILAQKTYEAWNEKKTEVFRSKKDQLKNLQSKEKEQIEEKQQRKHDAKKFFETWKEQKDQQLKDEQRKKRREENDKKKKEFGDKVERTTDAKKTFDNWKSRKEELMKEKKKEKKKEYETVKETELEKLERKQQANRAYEGWKENRSKTKSRPATALVQRPWCPSSRSSVANVIPSDVQPVIVRNPPPSRVRTMSATARLQSNTKRLK